MDQETQKSLKAIAIMGMLLFAAPVAAQTCTPSGAPRAMSADVVNGFIDLTFFWQDDCRAVVRALGSQYEYIEVPAPYTIGSAPWSTMLDTEWHEPWPSGVSNDYWFLEQDGRIAFGCPTMPCTEFGNVRTEGWSPQIGETTPIKGFSQWDDGDGPWFEFWVIDPNFGDLIAHVDRSIVDPFGPHTAHSAWVDLMHAAGITFDDVRASGKLNGHEGDNFFVTVSGDVWRVGNGGLVLVGNTFAWWPQDTGVQSDEETWGKIKVLYR